MQRGEPKSIATLTQEWLSAILYRNDTWSSWPWLVLRTNTKYMSKYCTSGAKLLMTIRINYTANAAKPHFCQQRQRQQPWRSSRAMAIQLCTKTASQRMPKVSWLVIYTSDHVTFTNIGILGNLFVELVRHEFPTETIWNHERFLPSAFNFSNSGRVCHWRCSWPRFRLAEKGRGRENDVGAPNDCPFFLQHPSQKFSSNAQTWLTGRLREKKTGISWVTARMRLM